MSVFKILAALVLGLHLLFIVWVIFGALLARRRRLLPWLHVASLLWGILIEVEPWSCPLTFLENWLEARAGVAPYQGGFLLHYLDAIVYPDISPLLLTIVGVLVCASIWDFMRGCSPAIKDSATDPRKLTPSPVPE